MVAGRDRDHASPPLVPVTRRRYCPGSGRCATVWYPFPRMLVGARRILSEEAQSKMNMKFYEELPEEKQKYDRGDMETKAAQKD